MSIRTIIRSTTPPALCLAALVAGLGTVLLASPRLGGALEDASAGNTVRTQTVRETLPYITVRKSDPTLSAGASKTVTPGKDGLALVTYRLETQGAEEIRRQEVARRIVIRPRAEVIKDGVRSAYASRGRLASRGSFGGRRAYRMTATGYSAFGGPGIGSRGASGLPAGYSMVAVDPKVIPLGTRLFVEGYGYAVAGDTGGAIKGLRIDLGQDSFKGALRVGRRHVVLHVLD